MYLRVITVGLALLIFGGAAECADADRDRDGLSDSFEQALLQQFAPRFMVSRADCAVLPSRFAADSVRPIPAANDGTIYGQAFPRKLDGGNLIELHYFHLWNRDCGRVGHALDAEHVSVLVEPSNGLGSQKTRALYWFAAAHQNTVCDASHGAPAVVLDATDRGATIWISAGKHASFLDQKACGLGCGGDRCNGMEQLVYSQVVNIGERDAPLNGAAWINSNQWPLAAKLASDFRALPDLNVAQVVPFHRAWPSAQATILSGGLTMDALMTSSENTESALYNANGSTTAALMLANQRTDAALGATVTALSESVKTTQRSVKTSLRKSFGWL